MVGATAVRALSTASDQVAAADRVVLPGVGAFGDCLTGLEAVEGMRAALEYAVIEAGRPFLGICVGMQLMADRGTEHGIHEGFGWIPGEVSPIRPTDSALKIPHMGWNELTVAQPHPVFDGLDGAHAYFVHGYAARPDDRQHIAATTDYGGDIVAALARDNICVTQFHPEKSQQTGLRLIANFLDWTP